MPGRPRPHGRSLLACALATVLAAIAPACSTGSAIGDPSPQGLAPSPGDASVDAGGQEKPLLGPDGGVVTRGVDDGDAAGPLEAGPRDDAGLPDTGVADAGASTGDAGNAGCGTGAVSFASDVMPLLQSGCTLTSTCHGQPNNAGEENLYLGSSAGSTVASTIHARLVGVASLEDPSMNLVTASALAQSYLWHKLIGDQNANPAVASGCAQAASACSDCTKNAPCGATEPYYGAPLPPSELCVIQRWIDQGALDN